MILPDTIDPAVADLQRRDLVPPGLQWPNAYRFDGGDCVEKLDV
jgi:hypothetical protein